MKSIIVKLGYVSDENNKVGHDFKLIEADKNEVLLEEINSDFILRIDKIRNLWIREGVIKITTKNTTYILEIL
ncbi:hypothetical protein [Fusobacterium sp. SYSU M8A802]